jgi:hypothetical protein
MSDPIPLDGCFYEFVEGDGRQQPRGSLVCADATTGEVKWAEKMGYGSMVYVDGCLLCLTYGGDLVLVEPHPEGFKKLAEMKSAVTCDQWQNNRAARLNDPKWKNAVGDQPNGYGIAPCWASPSVARGKVYLHYSDRLTCYDLMK